MAVICPRTETQLKFSRDPELWKPAYWKACPSSETSFVFPADPCPPICRFCRSRLCCAVLGVLVPAGMLICGIVFLERWTFESVLEGISQRRIGSEKTTWIKVPDDRGLLLPGYDVYGWIRVVEFFLPGLGTALR